MLSVTRVSNWESFLTAVNVGRRVLTADIDGAGTDNDGRQTRLFLVTSTLSLGVLIRYSLWQSAVQPYPEVVQRPPYPF